MFEQYFRQKSFTFSSNMLGKLKKKCKKNESGISHSFFKINNFKISSGIKTMFEQYFSQQASCFIFATVWKTVF